MNIYVWSSNVFRDYTNGDIVAIGADIDEARDNVITVYKDHEQFQDIVEETSTFPEKIITNGAVHFYGSA
jgi:hypothetical protein